MRKIDFEDINHRLSDLEKQLSLAENYSIRSFWHNLDNAYKLILPTRDITCIVCDFTSTRDGFEILTSQCQFGGGELERYTCPKCDCVFGAQKYLDLDESFVDLDYQLLYSRYSESDSTENEIRTFTSLAPASSGVYLDWGCGGAWSRTISTLRGQGFDVWGYEPSVKTDSMFVAGSKESITAKFDGIFSKNVIEHFRNPIEQFCEFYNLLKPGAKMAHSSPCYKYSYEFTRFHTLFLMGQSADALAKRTGFQVVDRIEDGEYINTVFRRLG